MRKKLLLIVVDGCTSRTLAPALRRGRLPTLQGLARMGSLNLDCSAIFPSITPAATASIVTGRYPVDHGIVGASWYSPQTDDVVYYGNDFWTILKSGVGHFFREFLVGLNHERLSALTLFQLVERAGATSASLNYLIYRGDVEHEVNVPLLLSLWPTIPFSETVLGPRMLALGSLVADGFAKIDAVEAGPFRRFGLDDEGTISFLRQLIGERRLPDLSVAYFADHDYRSHEVGPEAALDVVDRLDARLGSLLDSAGGAQAFCDEHCIVLTADHSHDSILAGSKKPGIELGALLEEFPLSVPGEGWKGEEGLMLCPNMRAAQVYFRRATSDSVGRVVDRLLSDERIDQAIWKTPGEGLAFQVVTADRGRLRFGLSGTEGKAGERAPDAFGMAWWWEGDLAAVDATIAPDGRFSFQDYPNAFERIAGGLLHPEAGDLWVTARPGFEFEVPGEEVHAAGGSHGSLHAVDSLVPLLAAGLPDGVRIPQVCRTVDVAPLCLEILGIEPPVPLGASHAARWRDRLERSRPEAGDAAPG